MTWREEKRELLTRAFTAGVEAAHPDAFLSSAEVRAELKKTITETKGRVLVLGAGKASAAMASALEREWANFGGEPLEGLVVTREGYETPTTSIEIARGGHPYPTADSQTNAERMLALVQSLGPDDLLIGLWSGGGSALLAHPPRELSFETFLALTKRLLASGANIHEVNTVRKHISRIAGGRLAVATAPASIWNIVVPDVAGGSEAERLSAVASGPCAPDTASIDEAQAIVAQLGVDLPDAAFSETPKSWEAIGARSHKASTMSPQLALDATAKNLMQRAGLNVQTATELSGEAQFVAAHHAAHALVAKEKEETLALLSGGELTVTLTGNGKGGPNQEYALALALALDGAKGICAIAGDTDGIDGIGEASGAFVFPDTLERIRAAGIDPEAALRNNDAGTAFEAIGDLLITGPTFTNLNDLRLIVIGG